MKDFEEKLKDFEKNSEGFQLAESPNPLIFLEKALKSLKIHRPGRVPAKKMPLFFAKLEYSGTCSHFFSFRHSDELAAASKKILVSINRYASISVQRNKNQIAILFQQTY